MGAASTLPRLPHFTTTNLLRAVASEIEQTIWGQQSIAQVSLRHLM
jgi:hypothetical protein